MFIKSVLPCVLTFPAEKVVFLKEKGSKLYSQGPYFLSKFIIEVIPSFFFCSITSLIVYWMVGLNDSDPQKIIIFILISLI